ncbi:Factor arrest protein 10 [Colletotrichum truncatum]|uniref:Factor arrest protein 10 n=1 Tax=Colletotrichum truncatum TaxID=5467 RepID=A0ACC3ZE64_COLTU|nr:Factor arrest protein 10 [Colletotrichum truncatum]KAF6801282.1 Factor arrest protein 10 [Colletotrichum truncatum]
MASSQTPQARRVLITLSAQHYRPEFQFPERRITLESNNSGSDNSKINIGRTSKRVPDLEAKRTNCFFDSPVMSRDHAELSVDWYHKKVYIKDTASLHGTYLNSQRLSQDEPHELSQGDTIKFGVDIQRSSELFPPCTVLVGFEFDPLQIHPTKSNVQPSFAVPDDFDSSEDDSDNESDVRETVERLRKIDRQQQRSGRSLGGPITDPIDLTDDSSTHEPIAEGPATVTIVLDDEVSSDLSKDGTTMKGIEATSTTSQPQQNISTDVDAPLDEIKDVPLPTAEVVDTLLSLDSDSESDNSDEDSNSVDYPDDDRSGRSYDSNEEDISLSDAMTDSDSEGRSEEEQEIDAETDDESENEELDEEIEAAAEYLVDCQMDDGVSLNEDEPHIDEASWNIPVNAQQQSSPNMSASMTTPQFYNSRVSPKLLPTLPAFQHATSLSYTSTVQPLPRTPWDQPSLAQKMQAENLNTDEFKLPPLLNQSNPEIERLSDVNMGVQQAPLAQPSELHHSNHPWQRVYVVPQSVDVAAESNPWCLPQNDGPSAQDLGQMTGKPEFFAAREYNKAAMRRQEECQQPSPEAAHSTSAALHVQSDGYKAQHPRKISMEASKSTKVPESAWETAGQKFLNTPQQEFSLSSVRYSSPELDMTSAFQFNQSKLAVSSSHTPNIENTDKIERTPCHKSPKRKADEISTLLPEEQLVEAVPSKQRNEDMEKVANKQDASGVEDALSAANARPTLSNTEQPPAKRFRFLPSWQGVGAFSVGGIMTTSVVVGMLAMTAPAL